MALGATPQAMGAVVNETMNSLGSTSLFNQGGLAFIRDAWIAANFGIVRGAEKVRLVKDRWPDFELLVGDRVEAFEAVEADDDKRRRGEEYREGSGEIDDPVENWIARAKQAPAWLQAACQKKIRKCYGGRANLVIYLNLMDYGIGNRRCKRAFALQRKMQKTFSRPFGFFGSSRRIGFGRDVGTSHKFRSRLFPSRSLKLSANEKVDIGCSVGNWADVSAKMPSVRIVFSRTGSN